MNINKFHFWAVLLIAIMFFLAFLSIKNESLTMDELPHLPAGYSYLTQKDMRINPEHPPLIKDIAALPLLFIKNINFPSDHKSWTEDVNGQWDFGNKFLFKSGNPADEMIFYGRIMMILVLMVFAISVYFFVYKNFGGPIALLTLFLFCFSPSLLAHGRLITTDIGAAFGVFLTIFTFFNFLKNPSKKNILIVSLALAFAELVKFSNIILFPYLILIAFVWWLINRKDFKKLAGNLILIFILFFIFILPIYQYHVLNYPIERQISDIQFLLKNINNQNIVKLLVWMADKPILRAYAQYFLGVFMVLMRVVGGNTTYFLGEITNVGWQSYFPIVYLLKESLSFHILTIIAVLFAVYSFIFREKKQGFVENMKNLLHKYFLEFCVFSYIVIYWIIALKSNLNIGVRHLLPAIALTYILVAIGIFKFLEKQKYFKLKIALVGFLLLWQTAGIFIVFPHFISYFNEIAGGYKNGCQYVVDSNYDWGQGLKRLKNWTQENNIEKIYIDYFGGADIEYYFGNNYEKWWGERNPSEIASGSYLAVSATFMQGGKGVLVKNFKAPSGYYRWLEQENLVARPDPSIFVFKIK
jgi:hypothetical protein